MMIIVFARKQLKVKMVGSRWLPYGSCRGNRVSSKELGVGFNQAMRKQAKVSRKKENEQCKTRLMIEENVQKEGA